MSQIDRKIDDHTLRSDMTDEEWGRVCSLRVFRATDMPGARSSIDSLIFAFRAVQLDREKIPEFRTRLAALARDIEGIDGQLVELETYGTQRVIQIDSGVTVVKHPHRALLDKVDIKKMRAALRMLRRRLTSGLSLLSAGTTGPHTEDIYFLVERLNEIVLKNSDGGPLTRSNKNRPGLGNDLDFVTTVVGIALKGTGRVVGRGTIDGAIKQLKKMERKGEQSEVISPQFEVSEVQSTSTKGILSYALNVMSQIRKRLDPL